MQVRLLSTNDDPRVLSKSTTMIAEISAKPTENCSIINPKLILNYSAALAAANYMYIPDFQRYYFIDSLVLSPGSQLILSGTVDVLMTYDAQIRQCSASVVRSESIGKPTIFPDSKLPIEPGKFDVTSIVLPNSLNTVNVFSDQYLLIVRG